MDPLCEYENKIPLINFFELARVCVCLFVPLCAFTFLVQKHWKIRNEQNTTRGIADRNSISDYWMIDVWWEENYIFFFVNANANHRQMQKQIAASAKDYFYIKHNYMCGVLRNRRRFFFFFFSLVNIIIGM